MNNYIKFTVFAAIFSTLTSCEKEIDFKYHDIEEQQVIEGLLTEDGVSVRLTKTVATDEPFDDDLMTDAVVMVKDITDNQTYALSADEDGVFVSDSLRGVAGHTYELTVDIDDNRYVSSSRMLPGVEIVSTEFNWIKMPYDDVAILKVEFTEDADPMTEYWLRVWRNGEIYQWQAIESRNAVDGIVSGMLMTTRRDTDEEDDDRVLVDGDVIDIEVLPISRVMSDYLNSLNNGDYNGNRMFEGSYCLGYFLAAPVATSQVVFHPDDIPYFE